MFNAVSKLYLAVAVAATVLGFAYVMVSSDRVGFSALAFSGGAAVALAVAVLGFTPREPALAAEEADEPRPVDPAGAARASRWPLLGALALAGVVAGMATDTPLILVGLVVGAVATFAWFGQVWQEHPSWTRAMTERLHDRFVVPIGLPGTIVVLVGIGVLSLSRLLLAVSKEAAVGLGTLIAFAILGLFYLLSTRDVGRGTLTAIAAGTGALVLASGVAGAVMGEREFHPAGAGAHAGEEGEEGTADAFELEASGIAFDRETLDLPADTEIHLGFVNHDEGVRHNFALLADEDSDEHLFEGEIIGEGETTYTFTTPDAGTYHFRCDVHPTQMKGTVNVAPDTTEPGEGGIPGGAGGSGGSGGRTTTTAAGGH